MNKKAFTLVELIVVITVLAILGTIGYMSFQGYSESARDANRISQISGIGDSMTLYQARNSILPSPENSIEVREGSELIGYQGYAGEDVLDTVNYNNGGIDPKDNTYFTYYLYNDRKKFQLMAQLEEELDNTPVTSMLSTSNAAIDYSFRYPTVYGEKLGVVVDENNTPAQEIESVKNDTFIDMGATTTEFTVYFSDNRKLTGSGSDFDGLADLAANKGKTPSTSSGTTSSTNTSCKTLLDGNASLQDQDGIYEINPTGSSPINVYCDMTTNGGGWTVVYSRKETNNLDCSSTELVDFITTPCSDANSIAAETSYSIGSATRLQIPQTQYLFRQKVSGLFDDDDAYILNYTGDIFPNVTGVVNNTSVDGICDINGGNCINSGIVFKYIADGYLGSSSCSAGFGSGYKGMYGVCNGTTGVTNAIFGNRSSWSETKLTGYSVSQENLELVHIR